MLKESDSDILRKLQRTATRAIPELRSLSYEEWLFTVSYRKFTGDLIFMYRILRVEFGPYVFPLLFLSERDNSEHIAGEHKAKKNKRTRD